MTLFYACHLIVACRIELIVGDRRHLCLELIQLHGDILILKRLRRYRIGRVVDQDIRVHTYVYQVNDVVVHDAALVGNAVQPRAFQPTTQRFYQLTCPYFRKDTCTQGILGQTCTYGNGNHIQCHRTNPRRNAYS